MCFTTKGTKCMTFKQFKNCFPANGNNSACAIEKDEGEETGYKWEQCSANCSKECLPGQWKCYDQCINQSEPCEKICKPSNVILKQY